LRRAPPGAGEGDYLERPRSRWLRSQASAETYRCLAAAADRSEVLLFAPGSGGDEVNAALRLSRWAKTVVELDRNLAAEERGGYSTCLAAMRGLGPRYAKDDLLVGIPPGLLLLTGQTGTVPAAAAAATARSLVRGSL